MPEVQALSRLGQEDCQEFKVSLGYILSRKPAWVIYRVRSCLRRDEKNKTRWKLEVHSKYWSTWLHEAREGERHRERDREKGRKWERGRWREKGRLREEKRRRGGERREIGRKGRQEGREKREGGREEHGENICTHSRVNKRSSSIDSQS